MKYKTTEYPQHRLILLLLGFFFIPTLLISQKVQAERLENQLMALAAFGRDAEGLPNRVAFSDGDIAGRKFVMGLMEEAGLRVSVDYAGNIIGWRDGSEPQLKPIAFGSHIDMVPNGGNYDGCAGSMAAIEVVQTLKDLNIQTRHPLELIIFSNEEGGVMGSRALAGSLSQDALEVKNSTGYTMREGIERLGGNPSRLATLIRKPGSLAGFLEMHIEQGARLYELGTDIGVVQGIVGLNWWDVTIEGRANHAGTTPMDRRKDALLAAAKFIQLVNETALEHPGNQVATVGRIQAFPGAPNVIPGKVVLSLEIRDLSAEVIQEVYRKIEAGASAIEILMGVQITFDPLDTTGIPALMDGKFQSTIEQAAKSLGYSTLRMPSGAGHDAQDMALICPSGMIFIPSKDGISHAPDEYSSKEALAQGANTLLHSILALDKQLN